jgi:hypothetical protein
MQYLATFSIFASIQYESIARTYSKASWRDDVINYFIKSLMHPLVPMALRSLSWQQSGETTSATW